MSKKLEDALTATAPKRQAPIPDSALLKTGSTILDLAISGRRKGGFTKGRYFWVVGDSSSGKTFLMLTCLAEASINKEFDGYRFIYDNVEDGALMNLQKYFGGRMAARLEAPGTAEEPYSTTIESFYYHLDDAVKAAAAPGGKQFIYVLDSMDALDSKYAESKFQEGKKAARGGDKAKGDYGDGKAKINSTAIRRVVAKLRATGSILLVLSQTRDAIDAGPFEEQQTHAGGRALKFYAAAQLWSSVGSKIKKSIGEREIVVGVHCRVKIKKNRLTGKERVVEFPIYHDTGIDDIGGMVDWLVYWGYWLKNKQGFIDAGSAWEGIAKRREDLIEWIDEKGMRDDLEDVVEQAWAALEKRLAVERKSKYD